MGPNGIRLVSLYVEERMQVESGVRDLQAWGHQNLEAARKDPPPGLQRKHGAGNALISDSRLRNHSKFCHLNPPPPHGALGYGSHSTPTQRRRGLTLR